MKKIENYREIQLAAKQNEKEREYWINKLVGNLVRCCFPYNFSKNINAYESKNGIVKFEIPEEIALKLLEISNNSDLRLFMILIAAITALLHKYTGSNDIIIGAPIFKQDNKGNFINTELALRNQFEDSITFKELLLQVRQTLLEATENQNYPIEVLLNRLNISSSEDNFQLLDVFVLLKNIHDSEYIRYSKPNILFSFFKTEHSINVEIEYNALHYSRVTIENIFNHLMVLMRNAFTNAKLFDIEILLEEEQKSINMFNDTATEYPKEKTINQLFEEQVERIPDSVALIFGDITLTYKELNEKANQLARLLLNKGIQADDLIGILMPRSMEMIIAIMGVLKTGGGYVPLDPDYPEERINYILEDSEAQILITQDFLKNRFHFEGEIIDIDDKEIYKNEPSNIGKTNGPNNLAYVIYTSGSTGKPKGVMIEHKSVNNFIKGITDTIEFNPAKTILCITTICFDIFVLETILSLSQGLKIVIADEQQQSDPILLNKVIAKNQVQMFQSTPTRIKQLLSAEHNLTSVESITEIMVGGEAIRGDLLAKLKKVFRSAKIYNMFGPTETTVWSSVKELTNTTDITIGQPLANQQMYIVDKYNHLVPKWIPGELCIAGDGLARGYFRREELTNERFVANPFNPGTKIYKTGDLALFQSNGEIQFLGRIDQQVKIRGFRIELGEIETQLLKNPKINNAVVVPLEDKDGDSYLAAYFVTNKVSGSDSKEIKGDTGIKTSELREFLAKTVPDYMVPSYFIPLDSIPLTPNGKIDRKSLPDPKGIIAGEVKYQAPNDEIEKELTEIWQKVLSIERIGIYDNFFVLGGHSLNAITLISQINKEYSVELSVLDIFDKPTIKEFSEFIKQKCMRPLGQEEIKKLLQEEFGDTIEFIKYRIHGIPHILPESQPAYIVYYHEDDFTDYDALFRFLEQKIPQVWHAHYIRPISQKPETTKNIIDISHNEFSKLLRLKTEGSPEKILKEIEEVQNEYNAILLQNPLQKKYPLSPIQEVHVSLPDRLSGSIVVLEKFMKKEILEKSFLELLKRQTLLRSILVQEENSMFWQELSCPEKISIPYIDLSSHELQQKNTIITDIINHQFGRDFQNKNSLLYRIIVIKMSLWEFAVVFPADHVIYDGMSIEIIKRSLTRYYQEFEQNKRIDVHKIPSFEEYVQHIMRGPQEITAEGLINAYELEEYRNYKQKLEAIITKRDLKEIKFLHYQLKMDQDLQEENAWDISYLITTFMLKRFLGLSKIPLKILSYGRRYQNKNYFDTVGEFIDLVPILVTVDEENPQKMIDYAQEKLAIASEHNINFMSLINCSSLQNGWKRVARYISPETISDEILFFNFRGKHAEKDLNMTDRITSIVHFTEQSEALMARMICEISYTLNTIHFYIFSTFESEIGKIEAILNNISEKVTSSLIHGQLFENQEQLAIMNL